MNKIVNGVVVPLTQQEINDIQSQESAIVEDRERLKRNILLSGSDVYALTDRITDEWSTYRQALRDVPSQSGFPDNITWPTKP
tara:strand:- start:69 stop:317 length:249 start_codon:yes stop_codon:yes gene_type:complete